MSFYEQPLFVDLLLWTIYVLLAVATGVMVWSAVRNHSRHSGKVSLSVWVAMGLLVATLVLTCVFADTQPLSVNGRVFADTFWLRVTGMLIDSSLVLMVVAALGVVFGVSGLSRHIKRSE